jgi:hypothetical protein
MTKRSQSALKELVRYFLTLPIRFAGCMHCKVFLHDGFHCPVTRQAFAPPGCHVVARAAHILPFSFHDKVCDYPAFMLIQSFNIH